MNGWETFIRYYEKEKEKRSEYDIIDSKDAMFILSRLLFKNNKFKYKTTRLQTKKLRNEMIKGSSDYQHQWWAFPSDPLALEVSWNSSGHGIVDHIRTKTFECQ